MKKYEAPFAKDLSAFLLKGQQTPQGGCYSGVYPFYNCIAGPEYIAVCSPGGTADTSYCQEGAVHTDPACNFGGNATTSCKSGGHQR